MKKSAKSSNILEYSISADLENKFKNQLRAKKNTPKIKSPIEEENKSNYESSSNTSQRSVKYTTEGPETNKSNSVQGPIESKAAAEDQDTLSSDNQKSVALSSNRHIKKLESPTRNQRSETSQLGLHNQNKPGEF